MILLAVVLLRHRYHRSCGRVGAVEAFATVVLWLLALELLLVALACWAAWRGILWCWHRYRPLPPGTPAAPMPWRGYVSRVEELL